MSKSLEVILRFRTAEVGTIHDEIADDIVRAAHVPVDTKEGQE